MEGLRVVEKSHGIFDVMASTGCCGVKTRVDCREQMNREGSGG